MMSLPSPPQIPSLLLSLPLILLPSLSSRMVRPSTILTLGMPLGATGATLKISTLSETLIWPWNWKLPALAAFSNWSRLAILLRMTLVPVLSPSKVISILFPFWVRIILAALKPLPTKISLSSSPALAGAVSLPLPKAPKLSMVTVLPAVTTKDLLPPDPLAILRSLLIAGGIQPTPPEPLLPDDTLIYLKNPAKRMGKREKMKQYRHIGELVEGRQDAPISGHRQKRSALP